MLPPPPAAPLAALRVALRGPCAPRPATQCGGYAPGPVVLAPVRHVRIVSVLAPGLWRRRWRLRLARAVAGVALRLPLGHSPARALGVGRHGLRLGHRRLRPLALSVGVGRLRLGVRSRARCARGAVYRRRPVRGIGRGGGALARIPVGRVSAGCRAVALAVGVLLGLRFGHLGLARARGRARRAGSRLPPARRRRAAPVAPRARAGVLRAARGVAPVSAVGRAGWALRLARYCGV